MWGIPCTNTETTFTWNARLFSFFYLLACYSYKKQVNVKHRSPFLINAYFFFCTVVLWRHFFPHLYKLNRDNVIQCYDCHISAQAEHKSCATNIVSQACLPQGNRGNALVLYSLKISTEGFLDDFAFIFFKKLMFPVFFTDLGVFLILASWLTSHGFIFFLQCSCCKCTVDAVIGQLSSPPLWLHLLFHPEIFK